MGIYNFKPQFLAPIEEGTKIGTIRAPRKGGREDLAGDRMHLFTGLRTPRAERIAPKCCLVPRGEQQHLRMVRCTRKCKAALIESSLIPVCRSVQSIVLREWEGVFEIWTGKPAWFDATDLRARQDVDILITTKAGPKALGLDLLSLKESRILARGDGFQTLMQMWQYWKAEGEIPFFGYWRIWCHEIDYFGSDPVLFARQSRPLDNRKPLVELGR